MPDSSQERSIGRLEGKVDALASRVEEMIRINREDAARATEARSRTYQRIEEVMRGAAEQNIQIAHKFDHLESRMVDVETSVQQVIDANRSTQVLAVETNQKVTQWEWRVTVLVGALTAVFTAAFYAIWEAKGWLWARFFGT